LDWYNRQAEKNTAERLIALRLYRYEIPWNELTEATLNQRSLEKVFQDHATVLIEVKP
jgi:hypothetical protein